MELELFLDSFALRAPPRLINSSVVSIPWTKSTRGVLFPPYSRAKWKWLWRLIRKRTELKLERVEKRTGSVEDNRGGESTAAVYRAVIGPNCGPVICMLILLPRPRRSETPRGAGAMSDDDRRG